MSACSLSHSWIAVGGAVLLAACTGCIPSELSQREVQEAANFVRARLQATCENAQGTTIRWTLGPQVAAGSDFVSVYGEFETTRGDGFRRSYICNAKLRRRDGGWEAVQMKVRDQAPRTRAQPGR